MMEIFKGNGEINGYAVINNKGMQSIESYVKRTSYVRDLLFAKQIGQNVKDCIIIPFWDSKDNRRQITAHPLGGCPLGEDAITGVVNSFGQVFRGQSGRNVYENL